MHAALYRALLAAACVALAGCRGSMSPQAGALPSHQALQHVVSHNSGGYSTKKSLLFVAEQLDSAINIYQTADLRNNPAPIATIYLADSGPYGMALDKRGTLYVADNSLNQIEEYSKGSTSLKTTITDGVSHPVGLAIDRQGTLYVTAVYPHSAVEEYASGSKSPSKTITGGGLDTPDGLAVDAAGNLYIADVVADAIFELPAGGSSITNLNLQGLAGPLGVAVDQKTGDLVELSEQNTVNVYQLGGSTSPIDSFSYGTSLFAIGLQNKGKPNGVTAVSDVYSNTVYAFKRDTETPYATLTNGISFPTGLLIAKP